MCWGYSKRLYREKPPAPKFEQIEENALSSLDQVPLVHHETVNESSLTLLGIIHSLIKIETALPIEVYGTWKPTHVG